MKQPEWVSLESSASAAHSRASVEPHPFYVFTTIWLALFLLGIAWWPTVPPRFQSESTITLQITSPSLTTGELADRLSEVAGKLVVSKAAAGTSDPNLFSEPGLTWRIDERPSEHRMIWHLMLAGRAPVAMTKRLSLLSDMAMQLLDEELHSGAISSNRPSLDRDMGRVPAWVAWMSNPALTRVMPGRSVTTSQVILLAAIASLAAGWFTAWSTAHKSITPAPEPTELAKRLDLPVLGVLDLGYSARRLRQRMAAKSSGFPWHRMVLRVGEVCVVLACSLTLLHSVRSREMRELFLSDPLTLFRSVVRPVSTASRDMHDTTMAEAMTFSTPPVLGSCFDAIAVIRSTTCNGQCLASLDPRVPEGN